MLPEPSMIKPMSTRARHAGIIKKNERLIVFVDSMITPLTAHIENLRLKTVPLLISVTTHGY